ILLRRLWLIIALFLALRVKGPILPAFSVRRLPQRNVLGARGNFLEHRVVDRELAVDVVLALKSVRHLESNGGPLLSVWKGRQKLSPSLNHGVALTRAGIVLQELRVQLRPV